MRLWYAWKKWSAFGSVPCLGVFLFVQVLLGTAFLMESEAVLANMLFERVSQFVFGEKWWTAVIASFAAAYVFAVIWKAIVVRYYYIRCTTRGRRKLGLPPSRDSLNVGF